MHQGKPEESFAALGRRHAELFGSIAFAKAALRLIGSDGEIMTIRCNLSQVKTVLVAIALSDPAMVTLDMSSSMKRMKKRRAAKVNTADKILLGTGMR
jgi:RNase P/RNase MRP subunit POP5